MKVYATKTDSRDADIYSFYAQLDETLDSIPRKDAKAHCIKDREEDPCFLIALWTSVKLSILSTVTYYGQH